MPSRVKSAASNVADQESDRNSFLCFDIWMPVQSALSMHSHDFCEFFLCAQGQGQQFTPEQAFSMGEHEAFFFPAGQPHYATRSEDHPCLGLVLYIYPRFLAQEFDDGVAGSVLRYLSEQAFAGKNRLSLSRPGRKNLEACFHRLLEEHRTRKPGFLLAQRLAVQELLMVILRDELVLPSLRGQFKPDPLAQRIDDVLRFVEMHYAGPIRVDQAAKIACLSRSHFHTVFKQHMGVTFIRYLQLTRIKAASAMLRESDASIVEVAEGCGFGNLSHFYHVFKAIHGFAPGEFSAHTQ
jgi:AraC-like DNA-binding protein